MAQIALASIFSLVSAGQTTPASTSNQDATAQTSTMQSPAPQTPAEKSDKAADKDKNANTKAGDKPSAGQSGTASGTSSGTSNDRLFYALPNFLSLEQGDKVPALTAKQKFGVVARGTFDPVQYGWWGFLSAISQANDSEPGFGQGWAGYGKRYGATAADGIIENFMTAAVLPSILHQDPRFFQSGKGGYGRRTVYAVSRIFITRSDSGRSQFNYSEVFGSAMSAAISTYSYHPRSRYISTPSNPHLFIGSDRTIENTASVWATQLCYDTFTIVIKEFWPDIHRKFAQKKKIERRE